MARSRSRAPIRPPCRRAWTASICPRVNSSFIPASSRKSRAHSRRYLASDVHRGGRAGGGGRAAVAGDFGRCWPRRARPGPRPAPARRDREGIDGPRRRPLSRVLTVWTASRRPRAACCATSRRASRSRWTASRPRSSRSPTGLSTAPTADGCSCAASAATASCGRTRRRVGLAHHHPASAAWTGRSNFGSCASVKLPAGGTGRA